MMIEWTLHGWSVTTSWYPSTIGQWRHFKRFSKLVSITNKWFCFTSLTSLFLLAEEALLFLLLGKSDFASLARLATDTRRWELGLALGRVVVARRGSLRAT